MNVNALTHDVFQHATPLLVLWRFQGEEISGLLAQADEAVGGAISRAIDSGDLKGKVGESLLIYAAEGSDGAERVLVLGAGSREKFDAEAARRLSGQAVREAEKRSIDRVTLGLASVDSLTPSALVQAVTEGGVLAAWDFRELKSGPGEGDEGEGNGEEEAFTPVETLELGGDLEQDHLEEGVRVGVALGRGENLARTLQNRPGNVATPSHLAEEATKMAQEWGLSVRVLGPEEMRAEQMNALLAVSQGSVQEPRLIVLEHRGGGEGDPPLVLVGKGLTFDAGGISIKPAAKMEDMKFDMSGGAAVIGAMRAIAELSPPLNVVGIVPSAENLPSGSAVKPGDVVRTRAGKTVEIINTDAEGRLILADALSFAQTFEPAAIVDCATLTGACVVALGNHASAVLGNEESLVEEILAAGERSGERCWPMPMWEEYRKQLDSSVADFMNIGGRAAGTITAACFLREFVGTANWAHIDIAGTSYGEGKLSYQRKGGYGVPARLLAEWVRSRSE